MVESSRGKFLVKVAWFGGSALVLILEFTATPVCFVVKRGKLEES